MKTQDKEPEVDPFLCRCQRCKSFWVKTFGSTIADGKRRGSSAGGGGGGSRRSSDGSGGLLSLPPEERAARTSMMYSATRKREDHPAVLRVGDRVTVKDKYVGVVKFVGILDDNITAPDTYVGIKTDEHIGSPHNGVYKGRRYFHCPRGFGLMAKYAEVIRINPPEKCPPIFGNPMFPSYDTVRRQRLESSIRMPQHEWTASKKKGAVYICDENDIAAKDLKRQAQREKKRQQMIAQWEQNRKVREDAASQQSFNKYKERFGGGAKGQRLAKTLQKLHVAYEEGVALLKEEAEAENKTETESQWSDYYSSLM